MFLYAMYSFFMLIMHRLALQIYASTLHQSSRRTPWLIFTCMRESLFCDFARNQSNTLNHHFVQQVRTRLYIGYGCRSHQHSWMLWRRLT